MRRNPLYANFRCQPLMSNIPGSFAWILSIILAVVAAVTLGNPWMKANVPPDPLPAQVETRINTVGYDKNQRRLPFTVYVLAQRVSWKLDSTQDLEGGQTLLNPELIGAINRARDVLCVGTASFEGGTQAEEARAAQRAAKLAQWVGTVIGNPKHTRLFTLSAGQYKGPKELASSYQRRAIILVTEPHDDDVSMTEALRSGLEQKQQTSPLVYSLLHHYSRSDEWLSLSNDPALHLSVVEVPGAHRHNVSQLLK
jgi:hypothetical protein